MKSTIALKWITLGSLGLLAACGGVSDIGSGDDPGKAGSVGTTTGGKGSGTGGISMGASANVAGKPGTVASGGESAAEPCKTDTDCGAISAPCEPCADGTYACDKTYCANGACVHVGGNTCTTMCMTDKDCPVPDLPCTLCMDGSKACPTSQCLKGQCQTSISGCGTIDPCKGLACGAECKACGPDGVCDVKQASYCSAEGKCQTGLPQCADPGMCKTSMDCGSAPPQCVPCGNNTCATFECIQGSCVFACPANPEPECKVTEDCPAIDADCKLCPNGECAVQACLQGSCELACAL
jgi:hypothetical protein